MKPGYRHLPFSARLGLEFEAGSHWRVDMVEAECFMYFIAGLRQVFSAGEMLTVEGLDIDSDLEALYKRFQAVNPPKIRRLLRHPRARQYHMTLGREFHRELSRFATCKTFNEICDVLMVQHQGIVLMDGSRIGERIALFHSSVPEPRIRKFCSTRVNGSYEWVEQA